MVISQNLGVNFENRGFFRLKQGARANFWRRELNAATHVDVWITPCSSDATKFGCSIFVGYHPSARDAWGEPEPYVITVLEQDLTESGLEPVGTAGASSSWNLLNTSVFSSTFDIQLASLVERFGSKGRLLEEVTVAFERSPAKNSLLMAAGFLQLELGDRVAARETFDRYLQRVPGLQKVLAPRIAELFR